MRRQKPTGKHRWSQGVKIRRPGALTRKAERAGETPLAFARANKHSSDPTTRAQANFAINVRHKKRRGGRAGGRG